MDPQPDIQAQINKRKAEHAARPHCVVSGSTLQMTLKSLMGIFPEAGSDGIVTVHFNGQMLSFGCHGMAFSVSATGQPWPHGHELLVGAMADAEAIEFRESEVDLGFWQTYLEIDGVPWIRERGFEDE